MLRIFRTVITLAHVTMWEQSTADYHGYRRPRWWRYVAPAWRIAGCEFCGAGTIVRPHYDPETGETEWEDAHVGIWTEHGRSMGWAVRVPGGKMYPVAWFRTLASTMI